MKNVTIAEGVCQSVDIRNEIYNFEMMRGCRIIEGFLQILLMDNATEKDFQNLTFPELREITEYMLVYHVKGLRTLHTLFPNLEVIRGDYLFTDYALAVYEMKQLEEVRYKIFILFITKKKNIIVCVYVFTVHKITVDLIDLTSHHVLSISTFVSSSCS